jgi:hypothetical protein
MMISAKMAAKYIVYTLELLIEVGNKIGERK